MPTYDEAPTLNSNYIHATSTSTKVYAHWWQLSPSCGTHRVNDPVERNSCTPRELHPDSSESSASRQKQTSLQDFATVCISNGHTLGLVRPLVCAVLALVNTPVVAL